MSREPRYCEICGRELRTGIKYCWRHRGGGYEKESDIGLFGIDKKFERKLSIFLILGILIAVPLIIVILETKPNLYQIFISIIIVIFFILLIRKAAKEERMRKFGET